MTNRPFPPVSGALGFLVFVVWMAAVALIHAETYQLENDYLFLRGQAGVFDELRMDPSGKSEYGTNLLQRLVVGDPVD